MFRFLRSPFERSRQPKPLTGEDVFKRRGLGPLGARGTGARVFDPGSLRLMVLAMIGEESRHGYDIIKCLRAQFQGAYAPSPGSIYPTLKLLEGAGLIQAFADKGKRRFAISTAGRSYLETHHDELTVIRERMDEALAPIGDQSLGEAARELADALLVKLRRGQLGPEKAQQLRALITKAREEIEQL